MIYAIHKTTKEHQAVPDGFPVNGYPINMWRYVQATPDGWIKHDGWECPLPDDAEHEVRFGDGKVVADDDPSSWCWSHDPAQRIVAYRPILDEQATLAGAKLWQDAEGKIPVNAGDPVGRVDCDQTGNAWTSSEDGRPVYQEYAEPPAWDGEGEPVIGEWCQLIGDDEPVEFMARGAGNKFCGRDREGFIGIFSLDDIRPIRSEEDRAVEAMAEALEWRVNNHCRERVSRVYRAIRDGKVPGVKLEGSND